MLVNAFLLGVGTQLLDHHHDHPPPPDPDQMIAEMSQHLDPPDARILRQAFEKQRQALEEDHSPQDMHRKVRDALRAEPFDANQLQAVFDNEERHHKDHGAAIGHMIVEAASNMSPEGRHRLAEFRPGPGPR